jgi:hypothetical protein
MIVENLVACIVDC